MAMNIIVLLIGGRNAALIPAASRERRAWHKPTTMQVGGRSRTEAASNSARGHQVTRTLLIEQVFQRERRQRIRVDLVTDASRFPADKTMTDLDRWHDLESDNPLTFVGMYQFWAQRT
jgi:hypothetical protein